MLVLVKLKIWLFQEKFLYIHYLVKNDNIPSSVEFQDLRQRRETKTNTFFLYRTCLIISIIERQDKDMKQTLIFFSFNKRKTHIQQTILVVVKIMNNT